MEVEVLLDQRAKEEEPRINIRTLPFYPALRGIVVSFSEHLAVSIYKPAF